MIKIFSVTSPLHDRERIEESGKSFLEAVGNAAGTDLQDCGDDFSGFDNDSLIFVRTGGTENIFLEKYAEITSFEGKIRLLTSGENNSLAASMEIASWLKNEGRDVEILHGTAEEIGRRLSPDRGDAAIDRLRGLRFGIIGKPSDWLISSGTDYKLLKEKLGIETVEIPISEITGDRSLLSEDRMKGAENIYDKLKGIVGKEGLNGITIRCFDLLGPLHNTGCLALARLNSEGIDASCEGDVPTLLTMAAVRAATGQSSFQANPSRFIISKSRAIFAHCTVPLDMTDSFGYDTHFESGLGIAIKARLPLGGCTVCKLSGKLDRYFVESARIVSIPDKKNLCRTQIEIEAPESAFEYFLNSPISNHHIFTLGNHKSKLKTLFSNIIEM